MQTPNEPAGDSGNCCDWQKTLDDLGSRAQELVHEDPAKALGVAAVVGVLLTILPVGRLIGGLLRLAMLSIRPLLLVAGAVKLYEEFDKRNHR